MKFLPWLHARLAAQEGNPEASSGGDRPIFDGQAHDSRDVPVLSGRDVDLTVIVWSRNEKIHGGSDSRTLKVFSADKRVRVDPQGGFCRFRASGGLTLVLAQWGNTCVSMPKPKVAGASSSARRIRTAAARRLRGGGGFSGESGQQALTKLPKVDSVSLVSWDFMILQVFCGLRV